MNWSGSISRARRDGVQRTEATALGRWHTPTRWNALHSFTQLALRRQPVNRCEYWKINGAASVLKGGFGLRCCSGNIIYNIHLLLICLWCWPKCLKAAEKRTLLFIYLYIFLGPRLLRPLGLNWILRLGPRSWVFDGLHLVPGGNWSFTKRMRPKQSSTVSRENTFRKVYQWKLGVRFHLKIKYPSAPAVELVRVVTELTELHGAFI